MKRIIYVVLVGLVSLFLFGEEVRAGGFNLSSIGNLDTSGKQISQWWYSGSSPVLRGEAGAGASVTVNIDGSENSVSADESGNWSYDPGALSGGDHQIVLTSGGSTISFTLTMGAENVNWDAVESGSGEAMPAAGNPIPTAGLLIVAMALLYWGRKNLA